MSKTLSQAARELHQHRIKVIPKPHAIFVRDGLKYISVHIGPGALDRAKAYAAQKQQEVSVNG